MGDALCKCGHPRDDHYRLAVFGCRYVDEKGKYPCCCRSFSPVVGEAEPREGQDLGDAGGVVEDSETVGADAETLFNLVQSLALDLDSIAKNDKTPRYDYGEKRKDGTLPEKGRWATPREIASDALVEVRGALTTRGSAATEELSVPASSDVSSETRRLIPGSQAYGLCTKCCRSHRTFDDAVEAGCVSGERVAPSVVTERQEGPNGSTNVEPSMRFKTGEEAAAWLLSDDDDQEIGGSGGPEPVVEQRSKACALCGRPAAGFATINGERYCHGDLDPEPTCYMKVSWGPSSASGVPFDDTEPVTTTALPSPELSPSVAEPGTPVGAKAEWVACDGLLHATIGTVAPEGYWPGMVTFEFDSDTGLVTADDARGIAAHLVAAADRADLATKEARP